MDNLALIGGLAGGIGLFLLGMGLMTDGLKLAAGSALERILASSTKTRIRGLASGILVTAVVQSSSAVTVAAIGFVNAGLLNLSQALWVLFGANVGTTMTGWLVALVSLKFKIEALALPLIGIGMILRLTGEGSRRGATGMAIAGFGVLFLGIDMLKETFSGLSTDFTLPEGQGMTDTMLQVLIGIVLTVLMQSSSAALAVALTAAQGGLLTAQGAAAVVIGANVGTTVTALIASLGATPNAKRAAAAHILFNLLTGMVALLLLPWLISFLTVLREWLDLDEAPAAQLALFHTVFNLLGIILIWPIASRMTAMLEKRFKSADEDQGKPVHLDKTVQAVPALALEALEREVKNMGSVAIGTVGSALDNTGAQELARNKIIVTRLNAAIAEFIVELNQAGMSHTQSQWLSQLMMQARYYVAATELAVESAAVRLEGIRTLEPHELPEASEFAQAARTLLKLCEEAAGDNYPDSLRSARRKTEMAYQAMKSRLLQLGVEGRVGVPSMDAQLRNASILRRALDQLSKASQPLMRSTDAESVMNAA